MKVATADLMVMRLWNVDVEEFEAAMAAREGVCGLVDCTFCSVF